MTPVANQCRGASSLCIGQGASTAIRLAVCFALVLPSLGHGVQAADINEGTAQPATRTRSVQALPVLVPPMNQTVQTRLKPQVGYFFDKLERERDGIKIDGVLALNSRDKFLPGKIAVGLLSEVLDTPRDTPRFQARLKGYREIADLTLQMPNDTWGIYYYLLALRRLNDAALLNDAISPETLAQLKQKLDWRSFVTADDWRLINLPTNYYGVAFSVARLRMLLGWEDDSASKRLLEKMLEHYRRYSGEYGFSDETDGEGRFDRYSVLLIAEICQRYVETGLTVTPELKQLLRKAAILALSMANERGEGFSFGRSIGPYGDTAMLEILSVAAYLGVLNDDERQYSYAYSSRIASRYAEFWFDEKIHSVDMWGNGRRTDIYRGKHRILGENFSLLHQIASTNALWNRAGFKDVVPKPNLQTWLDKTQPPFALTRFARGEYDRALAVYRDRGHVWNLLLVNGGRGQHDNSPYYPLPFSSSLVAGVPDSGAERPQLLPKFHFSDGTALVPTVYIKNIESSSQAGRHTVTYRQSELTRLGKTTPQQDARLSVETAYRFAPGVITRIDKYTPAAPVDLAKITLDFASFSDAAELVGKRVNFKRGSVTRYEVEGLDQCVVSATQDKEEWKSPTGAMKSIVSCSSGSSIRRDPFTIRWTLHYQ